MTHTAQALQSHDLWGEGIKLWITYILFWPHKDMEGLPGWVISPMPGPPSIQHKHERQYTPSTYSVIPTRRIWNDDYDGQMILGDLGGLKFPDICLTGEEKPQKNLTQETCPDRGSNLGLLHDKCTCYHLLHSGGPVHFQWTKMEGVTEQHLPKTDNSASGPQVSVAKTYRDETKIGVDFWPQHRGLPQQ